MPHNQFAKLRFSLAAVAAALVFCAVPQHAARAQTPASAPAAHSPIPDYGGRDSAISPEPAAAPAATEMNPVDQATRSVEALGVVLAIVIAVVITLKKLGLVKTTDTPGSGRALTNRPAKTALNIGGLFSASRGQACQTSGAIEVVATQALGAAANIYLVAVSGRTFLLAAATGQPVSVLSEWTGRADDASPAGETDRGGARTAAAAAQLPSSDAAAAAERLAALLTRSRFVDPGVTDTGRGAR